MARNKSAYRKISNIINDPDLKIIIQDIRDDYGQRILDEKSLEKREELYYEVRGLDRLVAHMVEFLGEEIDNG